MAVQGARGGRYGGAEGPVAAADVFASAVAGFHFFAHDFGGVGADGSGVFGDGGCGGIEGGSKEVSAKYRIGRSATRMSILYRRDGSL